MDALAGVTFGDPRWLLLIVAALPFTWWLVTRERLRRRLAGRFVSERLRGGAMPARAWRPYLLGFSVAAIAVALAQPRYGFESRRIDVAAHNRVIALDLSNSMLVRDVGLRRIDAAKALMQRIISSSGGRIALVVFERRAEIVAPLTPDSEAVIALLETLSTGETAEGGSDLGEGARVAVNAAEVADARLSDVIVISDGEDQGTSIDLAINDARMRNVKIHTVMIGTPEGGSIFSSEGPLKDEDGSTVVSKANAAELERLSRETGGTFFNNPFSAAALARLDETLRHATTATSDERQVRIPVERYQWPLAAAFIAALFAAFLNRGAA